MSSQWCVVCGQVNRAGAQVCEACDTRLGAGGPHFYEAAPETEPTPEGALPTDIPSPFFKGVGDVISPTLALYRRHFPTVGLLVLVTGLPVIILQYAAYLFVTQETVFVGDGSIGAGGAGGLAIGMAGGLLSLLATGLGNALLAGALAYVVVEVQRTGEARAAGALKWGLRKLPQVVGVSLLFFLMIYGLGGLLLGLGASIFGIPGMVLMVLLLLAPYIILTLMFSVAVPATAVENHGVVEAFSRSAELTRGYKGLIFLTYFLWGVLMAVVGMVVSGSFAFGGGGFSFLGLIFQTLISQLLSSTTTVLTVYIFLGLLNEWRAGFERPAPFAAAAER